MFVGGGTTGDIYSVPSTGVAVNHTATLSGGNNCTPGHLVDAPVVDSSTGMLYTQVDKISGTNCNGGALNGHTYQLTTSALATTASVTMASITNVGSGSHPAYDGAFDQAYYNASGNGGRMYLCMNGYIVDVTFNGSGVMTADTGDNLVLHSNADCSPITEFFNTNTNTDWIWAGNNGTVWEMNVTGGFPSGIAQSASATGGTSGIVVDNDFLAQPFWQASHSYAVGNLITDSNGDIEDTTTAGTSGSTQPAWCTKTVTTNCVGMCNDNFGVGCVTKDGSGTLRWTNQGPPGTASIYFGTLAGNQAVKLTQAGLQ